MSYSKKTWKGRLGTGLNKYIIGADEGDGKQTITSAPDEITQEGDALSASNLNDLENRIDTEFTNVNTEIDKIKDGTTLAKKAECDEDGNNIKATYAEKANYVPKADIVDGLSSSDATKVLSAKQGKALNDGKANRPSSPVNGDIPKLDANGDLVDSGIPASNVAQQDGYYEGLTAGNAEQLIASVFEQDKTPYNFRTSGGSVNIGDREYKRSIVGVSFPFNQLIDKTAIVSTTNNGVTIVNNNDGTYSLYGTAESTAYFNFGNKSKTIIGRKYLTSLNASSENSNIRLYNDGGGIVIYGQNNLPLIQEATSANNMYIRVNVGFDVEQSNPIVVRPQLVDLTLMFGSQIADYINTLETGTAGAGVAWFRKYFPKPYYAYNAGTLESVCVGEHNTIGFNQWDEEWEKGSINNLTGADEVNNNQWRSSYIPILPNTKYYLMRDVNATENVRYHYYDANKKFVSSPPATSGNMVITTPDTACYIRVRSTGSTWATYIKGQICINLHWDGERDGEYEPYVKHNYPLDHTKELRGIPKLDASNNLYYDGDVYEPDGTVVRKFGLGDMGTFSWEYVAGDNSRMVGTLPDNAKDVGTDAKSNSLCALYDTDTINNIYGHSSDKTLAVTSNKIWVYDSSYTSVGSADDPTSFLGHLQGVMLVYELATPTTEQATPYTELQIVDDLGTEEFVDYPESQGTRDVAIPVGHVTDYQPNLRAKLEMAPNNPNDNGKYLLQMDSGKASYVPYTDPDSRITALEDKVPAPPTTAGTYVLKVTVADGEDPDYEWVSES